MNYTVNFKKLIEDYVYQSDWRVRENANTTYSLQGLNHHLSSSLVARYWLGVIYPKKIAEAHIKGLFHIHDLGMLSAYCAGWDLEDLLRVGFTGVEAKTQSRPPKHFSSALGQMVNFLYTLQGEVAGAVAFSNVDTYMAPFIAYDGLTYKEVKQAIQEHIYNLNIPTRVGFQTPFVNYSMDLTPPPSLRGKHVIIGGKEMPETYGQFQREMDMFNRAFAEVMMEGDGAGRPFTFPIPTYSITRDFDWENPDYEPIWKMTGKYGIPYFALYINSDMDPDDVRSMCCRLRLDNEVIRKRAEEALMFAVETGKKSEKELDELKRRGGGLFGANPLTGSIGVVTINLPRIGYEAKGDTEKFFDILRERMELAKESLEIKRQVIEEFTQMGMYPYAKFYLRSVYELYGQYWANHFNTIGIIGMHEAILNMTGGRYGIEHPDGREFAVKVLRWMRDRLVEFQKQTGNIYNLEASPAEGASYRLARIDKKEFGDSIITSGEDEPYYTNSTFLPVDYTDDMFEALDHQDELQSLYTGGTVFHGFLGENITDAGVVKELIRIIAENYTLPYITLTPTYSICPNHGYIAGEHHKCPICGAETEVYSRVVGYLRPVKSWNDGKKEEFRKRLEFSVKVPSVRDARKMKEN